MLASAVVMVKQGVLPMFTGIAMLGLGSIGLAVRKIQDKEMMRSPSCFDDDQVRQSVVHARQDLRLIAYLLGAITIMLGIIADRIH